MALNSVNTNVGAMVALKSLEETQQQLSTTQKRIATGFRVADSTDDGAAFAIAQGVRSNVGALTSSNAQLGNATGLLNVTQTALKGVSDTMATMRTILVNLQNTSLTSTQRTDYTTQYAGLLKSVKADIVDATYNGTSLIGNMTGANGIQGSAVGVAVPTDESGNTYGVASYRGGRANSDRPISGISA